jgi:hypothetical protein
MKKDGTKLPPWTGRSMTAKGADKPLGYDGCAVAGAHCKSKAVLFGTMFVYDSCVALSFR